MHRGHLHGNEQDTYSCFCPGTICAIACFCYTEDMQKIATRIFMYASIAFGIVGVLVVLTASGPDKPDSALSELLIKLLFVTVFIILPSFALSIAGKYLNHKS